LSSLRGNYRLLIRPDNQTGSIRSFQFLTAGQDSDGKAVFASLATRYLPLKMMVTIPVRTHGFHLLGISLRKVIP
jgi:hypothetical protein